MSEVYIIGGGPSLKDFDFSKLIGLDTIVVNKAISEVYDPTYFITMDYTALRKIADIDLSNTTKVFIANLYEPYMKEIEGRIVDTRFNLVYDLKDFDMIIKSRQDKGIGYKWNDFRHGYNSGYGALQLAILLGYSQINLLGIDLNITNDTHFHGGYGQDKNKFKEKLEIYYDYFIEGLADLKRNSSVRIYNCSKSSRLNEVLPYNEV